MDTAELLQLQSDLAHSRDLRTLKRVRCLLAGNRSAKDRLSSSDGPLRPLLRALLAHLSQLAEQLRPDLPEPQELPSGETAVPDGSAACAEASEVVLSLHSIVITHPAAFQDLAPRRLVSSLLCLMQSRTYDLITACLRFLAALCEHALPHRDATPAQEAALALIETCSDLLADPKLLKLLLLSMSKNALVRELILAMFAGLAAAGAPIEAGGAFDAACPLSGLGSASPNAAFYTLLCHFALLARAPAHLEFGRRLLDSPAGLAALSDLAAAPHPLRTRALALAAFFRLYALCPAAASAQQSSFFAQALFGFFQLAGLAGSAAGCAQLGPVGRSAFWELTLCLLALPKGLVALATSCRRLLALLDAMPGAAAGSGWREAQLALLGACANRLEATRLQVAQLPTARRLLLSASASAAWPELLVELHLLFALSRSIEVLRSLLSDHPRLAEYALALLRRAMALTEGGEGAEVSSALGRQLLLLALQLAANLSLPVAGALRARLLHLGAARLLAQIATGAAFEASARALALAGLANLALRAAPEPKDSGGARPVSLRGPLPPPALSQILTEAESPDSRVLVTGVAHLLRNLMASSAEGEEEDDDDEEEEEEEEYEEEEEEEGLASLLGRLVALLSAPETQCGSAPKEAALLALACVPALPEATAQAATPALSSSAFSERLLAFLRPGLQEPPGLQAAALLAGWRLSAGLPRLPWRRSFRQAVARPEVAPLLRSEAGAFLRARMRDGEGEGDLDPLSTIDSP